MSDLFLETERGKMALSEDMVSKYNLKRGMSSPFLGFRIVDGSGNGSLEHKSAKFAPTNEEPQMFTTAEVLDIAQGADS